LGCIKVRWEDNIKLNHREIGIDGANWIQLAQDRAQCQTSVNMVMNLQVP
jgi:beta-galactosidase/beta-glucuronidase